MLCQLSDFSIFANRVLDKNREFLQSMKRGPIRAAVAAARNENEAGSASSCLKLNSPSSQSQSTSPGSSSFMPTNNTNTNGDNSATTSIKNNLSPLEHSLLTTIYQRDQQQQQQQHHHYNQLRPSGKIVNDNTMSPPTYSNLMLFNQNNNYNGNVQFRRTHSARPYPKPMRYIDATGREQIDYKYMLQQQQQQQQIEDNNNNNSIVRTLTSPSRFYSNGIVNMQPTLCSIDNSMYQSSVIGPQTNNSLLHFDQQQRQQRLDLILAQQNSLLNSNTIHPMDLTNHLGPQQPSPYPAHRQSLKHQDQLQQQQHNQYQHRQYFYSANSIRRNTKTDDNDNDDQLVEHIYDQNAYASPEITPIRVITNTSTEHNQQHQQSSPNLILNRNFNGNIDHRNIIDSGNHNSALKDQASVSQLIARFNFSNLV